jgi:hypothetical protein
MVCEVISGKAPITPQTAIQLERALGVPARLWNNLERNYREALAAMEERKRLQRGVAWLKNFGAVLRELIKKSFLPDTKDREELLSNLLNFFGVESPDAWERVWRSPEAAFRSSPKFESSPWATAVWLRLGEKAAQAIPCARFDRGRFREALKVICGLSRESAQVFQPRMVQLCAEAGVAVVFVPPLPGTRISGASRWLPFEKGLIQLSVRHKRDDHLWFTFFHEAAHLLLHGKKEVFLEDFRKSSAAADPREVEANRWAEEQLIPRAVFEKFLKGRISPQSILAFAEQIGIAPGIVVGRLQHYEIVPYSSFDSLVRRFEFANAA